jgi:hypothetical protein
MVEDDATRAVFFDPDDFGVEATITPSDGAPFTVLGIFDARPIENRPLINAQVGFKDGMQNTGAGPQFRCRTSDVAAVKAGRATLAIGETTYNVWDTKPDGTGTTVLILKLA